MDGCRVKLNVEELAGAIVAADYDDAESVALVRRLLDETEQAAKTQELIEPVMEALGDVLALGRALAGQPSAADLQHLAEAIDKLQKQIARCHTARAASCRFRQSALKQIGAPPPRTHPPTLPHTANRSPSPPPSSGTRTPLR